MLQQIWVFLNIKKKIMVNHRHNGSWSRMLVVLPVLGPSTVRDATAFIANFVGGDAWYNITVENDTRYFSDFDYYASKVMSE